MRRFLILIIGVLAVFSAHAAGENIPTSRSYVDSVVSQKQDPIERTTGANQVLTNTGTAGEYGTKGIYNSAAAYAGQTDALIDAATMNTGVQNAIDSEFQCIEWANPNDHTSDCLLMEIRGVTGKSILPTGYTALEYIEGTGTQYIDTSVRYTSNTQHATYDIDFQMTGFNNIGSGLWGAHGARTGTLWIRTNGLIAISMGATTSNQTNIRITFDTNRHHAVFAAGLSETDNNIGLLFDNTLYNTTYASSGDMLGKNIRLFSSYRSPSYYPPAQMKVYNFKIYLDNELKFNGIPAKRNADNEIGIYDTVTNEFLTNAGTGEFIAGPVVNLYLPAGN